MDQAIIPIAGVQRPWHMSHRRARRIGPVLLISLWLHLTLLLLLVVTVHYDHREEDLPPPSTVAMVFEGGKPEGPALPNPQPNVAAPRPNLRRRPPRHRFRRRRRSQVAPPPRRPPSRSNPRSDASAAGTAPAARGDR